MVRAAGVAASRDYDCSRISTQHAQRSASRLRQGFFLLRSAPRSDELFLGRVSPLSELPSSRISSSVSFPVLSDSALDMNDLHSQTASITSKACLHRFFLFRRLLRYIQQLMQLGRLTARTGMRFDSWFDELFELKWYRLQS